MQFTYFKDLKFNFEPPVVKQHKDFGIVYIPYTTVYFPMSVESVDFDSQRLHDDLMRQIVWEDWIPGSHHLRKKYKQGTSTILDDLLNIITNVKREILIKQMYEAQPYIFNYYWKRGIDFYLRRGYVNAQVLRDEPGFTMDIHKDNNEIIGQYIVNLIDNGSASTTFYNLNPNQIQYKAPSERKKGVGFLNTSASNHNIEGIKKLRYTLYFSVLQDTYGPDHITHTID